METEQSNTSQTNRRVALVTGASRGIGAAIAHRLAADGVEVILNGRKEHSLRQVKEGIEAAGGKARIEVADLSDKNQVIALAERCGHVDILVNNAASTEKYTSVLDDEDEHWEESFKVLMWAPVLLSRLLGRGMVANSHGVIINISSINAQYHAGYFAPYNLAKLALEAFTRCAAMELGPKGVRVNAIAPGIIRTQLTEELLGDFIDNLQPVVPVGRAGESEEVASLAAYLCSDGAAYVNGSVITMDGGMTAGNFVDMHRKTVG